MPLYEYRCRDCGATTEVIQKFSDPELSVCGECGGELERLLSAPAIRFKGSGWYVNDYGKKSSNGSEHSSRLDTSGGSEDAPSRESSSKASSKASSDKSSSKKSDSSKVA